MKLRCQHAVVSFCYDLTDPRSHAVPVAVLSLAEAPDCCVAVTAGRGLDNLDPISTRILADLPRLLKDHVSAATTKLGPESSMEDLLHVLYDSLRNSLHVSKITEAMEVELADEAEDREIGLRVMAETFKLLDEEIEAATPKRGGPQQVAHISPQRRQRMPASSMWSLPRVCHA